MLNEAAEAVINAYINETGPGYALLIDAPWGSGKTHIIKRITNCDLDESRLYVTLYDVHSPEAFDWALVRAMQPWAVSRQSVFAKQLRQLVSGLRILGFSIDLTKISFSEMVLQKIPDILIFDDMERCGLSHSQLSGLINRFVEHQKKRVILIANSSKYLDRATFEASREKLIGRTITLVPEVDAAISAVWRRLPDGLGRDYLESRQELLKRVFIEAGHQNLRLLLRSIRDAATMLNALPPDMLEFEQIVDRLLTTFLALHMAYHGGELSKEDMLNRARIRPRLFLSNEEKKKHVPDNIEIVQSRHPNSNVQLGYSDVLPLDIAYALIVDGYAISDDIVGALRGTHQFSKPNEKPDWVRLWEWVEEPIEELEKLLTRIQARIESLDITEPGEILQLHAAKNFMSKFLLNEDKKMQARRTFEYICRLSISGRIRPSIPSNQTAGRYGFSAGVKRIAFGGYVFEPDRRDMFLARLLMAEMDKAFENRINALADHLLCELRSSPEEFMARFDYNSPGENFSETPVLHRLPAEDFASIMLERFEQNREIARSIALKLSERRKAHRTNLSAEIPWFAQVEQELVRQAKLKSDLLAGQIRGFLLWHFSES